MKCVILSVHYETYFQWLGRRIAIFWVGDFLNVVSDHGRGKLSFISGSSSCQVETSIEHKIFILAMDENMR